MALDFDGATSKIQHDTASLDSATFSILAWINLDSLGENNAGRIMTLDESNNAWEFETVNAPATPGLDFEQPFSINPGFWWTPGDSLVLGRWLCVALSYDRSSDANDPIIYIRDTASQSVLTVQTLFEASIPSGTATTANTGYCVGNRATQDRTFDGRMAYLQYWNRILTSGELNQAMHRPGSVPNGLRLYLPMLTGGEDWSGNGQNGTTTATTIVDGPPVAPLWFVDIPQIDTSLLLEQEGFRWRADNGDEDGATWLDSQDVNITRSTLTNTRLRTIINATGDPGSNQYQLEYRKVGDTNWKKVNS